MFIVEYIVLIIKGEVLKYNNEMWGLIFTFCHYYHAISRSHHLDRDTFLIVSKKLILYKETLKGSSLGHLQSHGSFRPYPNEKLSLFFSVSLFYSNLESLSF